jgi:5-methylcytosine-specific restriction endonuclease McrA
VTRRSTGTYPENWKLIAAAVKQSVGNRCVRCNHPHDPANGYTLTVHHADMDPGNSAWWNLLPLCQRCHLSIQGRVYLDRPWVMLPHSEWFQPYVAGFYAKKYLGEDLTREETMARLDELLQLERQVVLGVGV